MAKRNFRYVLDPKRFYNVVMETSVLVGEDQDFIYEPDGIPVYSLGIDSVKGITNEFYLKRIYMILKHLNPQLTYSSYEFMCWVIAHPDSKNMAFPVNREKSNIIAKEAWEETKPLQTKKRKKVFFNESRGFTKEEKISIAATLKSGGWSFPDGELVLDAMNSLETKKIRITKETLAEELGVELNLMNRYYRQAGKAFKVDINRRNFEMKLDERFDMIFDDLQKYWKKTRRVRKFSHYSKYFRVRTEDNTKLLYLKAVRKLKLTPAYKKFVRRKEEQKYE